MLSIRTRLLLAGSAVLVIFLGLGGAALETAFRDSARTAERQRLQGLVYTMLGAGESDARGALTIDDAQLPEPRLHQPQSGLEAVLLDESGRARWQSESTLGAPPAVPAPDVGEWWFDRLPSGERFALAFGLRWVGEDQRARRYTAVALEDTAAYEAQVAAFRRTLRLWLLLAAAGLLAALLVVQRWGLAPLRRLVRELHDVETGTQPQVGSAHPAELVPLTSALNAMIRSERSRLERQRNALGDLAHSLKTPLAVLRGIAGDRQVPDAARATLDEQVGRMLAIVEHQLATAATAGRRTLSQPLDLRPVLDATAASIRKVYRDKNPQIELRIAPDPRLRADESDVYDLLGNLLDNAAKWCRTRIVVTLAFDAQHAVLTVEDDGAGFPSDPERLLQRGVRADSRVPGHGIGLATVAAIVRAYEGAITLDRGALGGGRVTVRIPT